MTPRYHINLFWSDEDDAWIADAPDLTYCSAHGATPEEALWGGPGGDAGVAGGAARGRPAGPGAALAAGSGRGLSESTGRQSP
jgi:hypothetical protein